MSGEDFDLAGAGKLREVDGASAADAGGGGLVGGDGWKVREQLAGVDEEGSYAVTVGNSRFLTGPAARFGMTRARSTGIFARFGMTILYFAFDLLDGMGLTDIEFGDGGAAERFEMGSAAEALAHLVGNGTHVGSGGNAGAEVGAISFEGGDGEFFDFDLNWREHDFLLSSRQLVSRNSFYFFGGEWRRGLLDDAEKFGGEFLEDIQSEIEDWRRTATFTCRTAGGRCPHMFP